MLIQILTVKHCLEECSQLKDNRIKYNIYKNIEIFIEKCFVMGKLMKFFKKNKIILGNIGKNENEGE